MTSFHEESKAITNPEVFSPTEKMTELATTAASACHPALVVGQLASKALNYLEEREKAELARTELEVFGRIARTKIEEDGRIEIAKRKFALEQHRQECKQRTKDLSKRLKQQDRKDEKDFQATMGTLSNIRQDNRESFEIAREAMSQAKNAQGQHAVECLRAAIEALKTRK